MNSMDKTREFLKSIGLPGGDAYDLPTSEKRFADGGQYRFEVPGIQGPKVMKALLEAIDSYGMYLHRVTQTQGIMCNRPPCNYRYFCICSYGGRRQDGLPSPRPGAGRASR